MKRSWPPYTPGNTPEHSVIAYYLPAPLANRFTIVEVDAPSVDEWARWMDDKYGDWDKRVYAFHKAFNEEYFILSPREGEVLENFPTPRSWTALALMLSKGLESYRGELARGLVGKDVGQKFDSFCSVDINIEELINKPEEFELKNLDWQYMATFMLAKYLEKRKPSEKVMKLIDVMCNCSAEFVVALIIMMSKQKAVELTTALIERDQKYSEILEEVVEHKKMLSRAI